MASAASRLGVKLELLKHVKDLGWECFRPNGTVDCHTLRRMLAEDQAVVNRFKDMPVKEVEEALILRERRLALQDKRALFAKTFKHIDEIRRECMKYVGGMKSRQVALETNVCLRMRVEGNLNPAQESMLREIVIEESRAVMESLQRGDWFKGYVPGANEQLETLK